MSLGLLLKDELRGFYKSNVMLILWIGLPLLSILLFTILPQTKEIPFSLLYASIISSLGGTLSSVMLAVYIIHEKSRNVFELFLVRPVRRDEILNAKFLAVFICVSVAMTLSLLLGITVDSIVKGDRITQIIDITLDSFILSISTISLSCSIGILVGILSSTVLVGVLLIIFVAGNVSSTVLMLPTMLELPNSSWVSFSLGIAIAIIFQFLAIFRFRRMQF
jgi:ABC-2 type transport system permease protein